MTPETFPLAPGDFPTGELTLHGRVMPASNATFVGEIGGIRVVYKPIAGERPLWDFPDGTLANREVAAYAVSEALGWDIVPPTVLGDGPHGPGMVQLWRDEVDDQDPVDTVREGQVPAGFRHVFDGLDAHDEPVSLVHEDSPELRRMALFDVVVNNAAVQTLSDFLAGEAGERQAALRAEISLNFDAVVALSAGLLGHLRKHPAPAVVNVTSGLALAPKSSSPVYCATKAAVRSFTKALRYQCEDRAPHVQVVEAVMPLV